MRNLTAIAARLFASSLVVATVHSADFGNLSVTRQSPSEAGSLDATVDLLGADRQLAFGSEHQVTFWNLKPGVYGLVARVGSAGVDLKSVQVLPGLTTRVELSVSGDHYELRQNGFLDLSAPAITLDANHITDFPGELRDGVGNLTTLRNSTPTFSWEGLELIAPSQSTAWTLIGNANPEIAFANTGDPFAGYDGADISFVQNATVSDAVGLQSIYGTRDRRFQRGYWLKQLPGSAGNFFGSLTYENLADAEPRANLTYRLPHNGAKNLELLAGAGARFTNRFHTDARFVYEKRERNYYEHPYLFDMSHAPRSEAYIYRGRGSVYGWLSSRVFASAGIGVVGDDSKTGDGLYFDNLAAYNRAYMNSSADRTGLLYQWDEPSTPNVDESHVYDKFARYRTNGWSGDFTLCALRSPTSQFAVECRLNSYSVRKFVAPYATHALRDYFDVDIIGFDSLAQSRSDRNGLDHIPRPTTAIVTLSARRVVDNYFGSAALDFMRFDPGSLALRNPANPLDPDTLMFQPGSDQLLAQTLDPSDMRSAKIRTYPGLRLAAGARISPTLRLFANYEAKHVLPSFDLLYAGWDYFEFKVRAGGYYYPLGNPDLKASRQTNFCVGIQRQIDESSVSLAFRSSEITDAIDVINVWSIPNSYTTYTNSSDWTSRSLIAAGSLRRSGMVSGVFSAALESSGNAGILGNSARNILWAPGEAPLYVNRRTLYKASGVITLDPSYSIKPGRLKGLLSHSSLSISILYASGVSYVPGTVFGSIFVRGVEVMPIGELTSEKARDFLELNLGLTVKLAPLSGSVLSLRLEVLNLFDRKNALAVYNGTGLPDNTGWLNTSSGQEFINAFTTLDAHTGLTGEQTYRLMQNDPNHFGRPRMIRVMGALEF